MMEMRPVVLVTGASSGIGYATALLFAKKGYDVVIHYCHGEDRAVELSKKIQEDYSVQTFLVKADVSNETDVIKMVNDIIEKFGRIDVLINNAGIAMDSDFSTKRLEDFKKIIDVNLIGTYLVSKSVFSYMKKWGRGSIVNVGSTNGINSYYPYSMEYDASKAGVHVLTKDLAIELAPNIRVNAVAPGWVNTPMNADLSMEFQEEELKKIVLERFADPMEIANVIYFLASDEASYINGEVVVVDGGRK